MEDLSQILLCRDDIKDVKVDVPVWYQFQVIHKKYIFFVKT